MRKHSTMYHDASYRQKQIFVNGMAGIKPTIPLQYDQLEQKARLKLGRKAFGYIATGAGKGTTKVNNRSAFDGWNITPRMPNQVSQVEMKSTIGSVAWDWPIFLSPIGVLCLAHKNADMAVAQAVNNMRTSWFISNQASRSMEQLAREMSNNPYGFQLYYSKNEKLSKSLVQRAEACGCQYIVVTLDTTRLGWRPMDLEEGFLPFLTGRGLAQYTTDPVFIQQVKNSVRDTSAKPPMTFQTVINGLAMKKRLKKVVQKNDLGKDGAIKIVQQFIQTFSHPSLGWEELQKVRSWTKLPIYLKGILSSKDALKAKEEGFDGLIISNHGGRQVDGAQASLSALQQIRQTVGSDWTLLMDSGVRTGSDIFKALALGANAVGIGRPYAYALAIGGVAGVEEYLHNLRAEFELTMSLCGCENIFQIKDSFLTKSNH